MGILELKLRSPPEFTDEFAHVTVCQVELSVASSKLPFNKVEPKALKNGMG